MTTSSIRLVENSTVESPRRDGRLLKGRKATPIIAATMRMTEMEIPVMAAFPSPDDFSPASEEETLITLLSTRRGQ